VLKPDWSKSCSSKKWCGWSRKCEGSRASLALHEWARGCCGALVSYQRGMKGISVCSCSSSTLSWLLLSKWWELKDLPSPFLFLVSLVEMNFFMLASQVNKQELPTILLCRREMFLGFIATTTLSLRRLRTLKRRENAKWARDDSVGCGVELSSHWGAIYMGERAWQEPP